MTESSQELNFVIDGKVLRFPALADKENAADRFTLNASSEGQIRLRRVLDAGSRATVSVAGYGQIAELNTGVETTVSSLAKGSLPGVSQIRFSLLGSRKAAVAAEAHCLDHEPIPFESN